MPEDDLGNGVGRIGARLLLHGGTHFTKPRRLDQQVSQGIAQRLVESDLAPVLLHDFRCTGRPERAGIGKLVVGSRVRIRHKHGGQPGHGEFSEGRAAGARNGKRTITHRRGHVVEPRDDGRLEAGGGILAGSGFQIVCARLMNDAPTVQLRSEPPEYLGDASVQRLRSAASAEHKQLWPRGSTDSLPVERPAHRVTGQVDRAASGQRRVRMGKG